MSNRRLRGEVVRRAAVRADGMKREPSPLQALHDLFAALQRKRITVQVNP